jgi:hypothetical protein
MFPLNILIKKHVEESVNSMSKFIFVHTSRSMFFIKNSGPRGKIYSYFELNGCFYHFYND